MSSVDVDPSTESEEENRESIEERLPGDSDLAKELLDDAPGAEEIDQDDRTSIDPFERRGDNELGFDNTDLASSEEGEPAQPQPEAHGSGESKECQKPEEEDYVKLDAPKEEMAALDEKLKECQADNPPRLEIKNKQELARARGDSEPKLAASQPEVPRWGFEKDYHPTVRAALLCQTFDVNNEETAHELKRQITKMTKFIPEPSLREMKVNSILASLYDMTFENQWETREAIQALIADSLGKELAKKGMIHEHPETQEHFLKWANKFMDQYTKKKDSLSNANESQQTIRVERVNVEEDSQAVMGNFQNDDKGGGGEDG
jgi:hypothetical protein